MQSHSREATCIVTPFDKYAESKSRSDCCAVTVAKRLLPHFVKYAESHFAQPRLAASNLIFLYGIPYLVKEIKERFKIRSSVHVVEITLSPVCLFVLHFSKRK